MSDQDQENVRPENFGDDPDEEVEMGDLEARMDNAQSELDQLEAQEELDIAVDSRAMADNAQLDEA